MVDPLSLSRRSGPADATVGELLLGRFEVREMLGSGGFGRVYRCFDRETEAEVALKELHRFGPDALLRFKNEFRLLSDIHHPNLVRIGELFQNDDRHWAFTMEYVPGTDLLSWVRAGLRPGQFDGSRLCSSLSQLARGLDTLHSLGLLHRDVKPENVRVTPQGRVVLLDFGLVTHLSTGQQQSAEATAVGTASFMAPEQPDQRVGPKADFYALGVLLYEVLTGRLPFEGPPLAVMLDKAERPPIPPSEHNPHVPAHLEKLCMHLLRALPEERAGAAQVLEALGEGSSAQDPISTSVEVPRARDADAELVGREGELTALHGQWKEARDQGLRVVLLEGQSGIGKTALMDTFVRQLRAQESGLLVLRGRCHAAELVRYKLWDEVADGLCKHLGGLDELECQAIMPSHPEQISMLFPVLTRVPALSPLPRARARARARSADAASERFTAFTEFGVLLWKLAQQRPLLVCVDDVQWGDLDSLAILQVMFALRKSPRVLIVGTVRPLPEIDPTYRNKLTELMALHERVTRIEVGALSERDARRLSAKLTGLPLDHPVVRRVAAQTRGHPWFATELAHHLEQLEGDGAADTDLDGALRQRVGKLGPTARRVMEVLSIGGGPQPASVLREALNVEGEALEHALAALRAHKLIRPAKQGSWACYHDRVGEAVSAGLHEVMRRTLHAQLALAWAVMGGDPLRIAGHWQAAGEPLQALPWLRDAAEQAERAGAYERAAELYAAVLAGRGEAKACADELHALQGKLSDALASAGRCGESARVLLQMLGHEGGFSRAELHVRAAERLLKAGLTREGVEAARQAFAALDLTWPRSPRSSGARMLWHQLWLKFRRVRLPTEGAKPTEKERMELETLWRFSVPIAAVDMERYAELTARHLRLSLRVGAPKHIALSLLGAAASTAATDPDLTRCRALLEECDPWVDQLRRPEVTAFRDFVRGTCAAMQGDHGTAMAHLIRAEQRYVEECPTEAWMRTNVRATLLSSWLILGDFEGHASQSDTWITEAHLRQDVYAESSFAARGMGSLRYCLQDRPDRAMEELSRLAEPWGHETVGLQRMLDTFAQHMVLRYRGDGSSEAYWRRIWPDLSRSVVMRLGYFGDLMRASRLSAALDAFVHEGATSHAASAVRAVARSLGRAKTHAGRGHMALMTAQAALLCGDTERALERARQARSVLEGSSVCFAHAANLLEQYCLSPTEAREGADEVLSWYETRGWQRPDLGLQMFGLPIYPWLVQQW